MADIRRRDSLVEDRVQSPAVVGDSHLRGNLVGDLVQNQAADMADHHNTVADLDL